MRFSFTPEQEEFRASLAAGAGSALAHQGGAAPDGDRGGLRARGLEEAQPGARPHRCAHPRRPMAARASASASSASCSRRWAAACSARPSSRPRAGRDRHPECRNRGAEARAAARPSPTGDTTATLAFTEDSGADDAAGVAMTAHRRAAPSGSTAPRASCSTATPPISSSCWRASPARTAITGCRSSPCAATPPGLERTAAQDHGRDAQAGAARRSRTSRRGCWARPARRAAPFAKTMQQAADLPRQRDGWRRRAAARERARLRARCACSSAGRSPRSSR